MEDDGEGLGELGPRVGLVQRRHMHKQTAALKDYTYLDPNPEFNDKLDPDPRDLGFHTVTVSILSIFPLPNHSSRIFFRDITNDAKKR